MYISIVGGSGFVGTNLIKELENSEYQIQNIDNQFQKYFLN